MDNPLRALFAQQQPGFENEVILRCLPMIRAQSFCKGQFDEELFSEQLFAAYRCIQKFQFNESDFLAAYGYTGDPQQLA